MTVANTNRRSQRNRGRVVFLRRNRVSVVPPDEVKRSHDPIVESIGAFADFPVWDDFLAIMEANRQERNARVGGVE